VTGWMLAFCTSGMEVSVLGTPNWRVVMGGYLCNGGLPA